MNSFLSFNLSVHSGKEKGGILVKGLCNMARSYKGLLEKKTKHLL